MNHLVHDLAHLPHRKTKDEPGKHRDALDRARQAVLAERRYMADRTELFTQEGEVSRTTLSRSVTLQFPGPGVGVVRDTLLWSMA
jgi:hypothetical protein